MSPQRHSVSPKHPSQLRHAIDPVIYTSPVPFHFLGRKEYHPAARRTLATNMLRLAGGNPGNPTVRRQR